MSKKTLIPFVLRPHDSSGTWESNDARYRAYAHELLDQLEELTAEIHKKWPKGVISITDKTKYPELWKLTRIRDRTSDNARIYAAMAVEGFLNFYGVLRLGQKVFDEHFERLSLIQKLQRLILISESIVISQQDPLVKTLESIAKGRNSLVHPKALEIKDSSKRTSTNIPDVAKKAVDGMESFFKQFALAVPAMLNHIETGTKLNL